MRHVNKTTLAATGPARPDLYPRYMAVPPVAPTRESAVVPAHNEQAVIARCVRSLLKRAEAEKEEIDLVVVCNGCTDGTADAARRATPKARVLEIPYRLKELLAMRARAYRGNLELARLGLAGTEATPSGAATALALLARPATAPAAAVTSGAT